MAVKGDWVQLHTVVLEANERAANIPEDTRQVPLEMWVKGFLTADAEIGDSAEVLTPAGRRLTGTLAAVNPRFPHDFGDCVPELYAIGEQVRSLLEVRHEG